MPMKHFYFDTNARVRFDCEASTEDEASDYFGDALQRAQEYGQIQVDVDTYIHDRVDEPIEEEEAKPEAPTEEKQGGN